MTMRQLSGALLEKRSPSFWSPSFRRLSAARRHVVWS